MIIPTNPVPDLSEFKKLIDDATLLLNNDALKRSEYYLTRNAQLLEDDVLEMLCCAAKNTKFEGKIKKISGQRFPDITVADHYGVEVKSSKDEKWLTLGGSVNESTRVDGIRRIFLIFGKLTDPIEFRSRPYEDCLSDVVVTHYPRYRIDMNLLQGETIFNKMTTTYDNLRLSDNPVGKIVDHYKRQLADGESLWWIGNMKKEELNEAAPIKIRLWKALSVDEKNTFKIHGFALFPDLLSSSSTKYERFSLWLVANHGVVSTSTRDSFSAGGQGCIKNGLNNFYGIPRALINVEKNSKDIYRVIYSTDESILRETWQVETINDDRVGQWIDIAAKFCLLKKYSTHEVLNTIFSRE